MEFHFANCTIDPDRHAFFRDGSPVHIEPQVFELLLTLIRQEGRLVTKEELIETVWRGLNVSDSTISARINSARKAVGDTGQTQQIIKTIHGRGFKLLAKVTNNSTHTTAESVPDVASSQRIQFTQSTAGTRIAYAQSGLGPPLIRAAHWLSHLELDWHRPVWRPLMEKLGNNHTLYCYDQRGTGLSSRSLENVGLDDFVQDLKSVADASELQSFPIFAASQAVPVAIRFAHLYPERVSSLVLYGGYAEGRALRKTTANDIDEATILGLIRAGWGKIDSPFVKAFTSLFLPDATTEQMESFVQMQNETISPDNAARLRQIIDRFDVKNILSEIKVPTLVIHASSDAVQPIDQGRILASEIPNARYISLESRNHVPLPQEACWESMMQEIEAFLEIQKNS